MNVLLRDTEEFLDGKNTGTLGLVLIRCVYSVGCYLGGLGFLLPVLGAGHPLPLFWDAIVHICDNIY